MIKKYRQFLIFGSICCAMFLWIDIAVSRTKTIGPAESLIFGEERQKASDSRKIKTLLEKRKKAAKSPIDNQKEQKSLPPKKQKKPGTPASSPKKKTDKKNIIKASVQKAGPVFATMNNVRMDFYGCKYDSQTRSAVCSMQLTSLQGNSNITLLCYSGTQATDSTGNIQECMHAWIGNNHSWNYASSILFPGKPERAMVRFKLRNGVDSLNMQYVFTVDKSRKMISLKDVAIQR